MEISRRERRAYGWGVAALALGVASCQTLIGIEDTEVVAIDAAPVGACAVQDACDNPNPDHCATTCEDRDGEAVCTLAPADRDGDEHGDVGCTEAPGGDDCDDARDSVHPGGSEEACDGLDNDCDGLFDLQEGQLVAGAPATFAGGADSVQIAWAPGIERYGIAWARGGEVRFNLLDETGVKRLPTDATVIEGRVVGMAAGPDVFGLLVVPDGTQQTLLHVLSATGETQGSSSIAFDQPFSMSVAYLGNDTWAVVHDTKLSTAEEPRRRRGTIVSRDGGTVIGDATTELPFDRFQQKPQLAVRGSELVAVWRAEVEDEPDELFFARYSANLTQLGETRRFAAAIPRPEGMHWGNPVIATSPRGYAVAWGDGVDDARVHDGFFVELDPAGDALCGPRAQTVNAENRTLTAQSVTPLPDGGFALGWQTFFTSSGSLHLTVMRDDCRGDEFASFEDGGFAPIGMQLATGNHSVLAAWNTLVTETSFDVETRVMGPHLCDPPSGR